MDEVGAHDDQALRLARLAELVVHLTECSPVAALNAVVRAAGGKALTNDNSLDVLARAIFSVHKGIDLRDVVNLVEEADLSLLRAVDK